MRNFERSVSLAHRKKKKEEETSQKLIHRYISRKEKKKKTSRTSFSAPYKKLKDIPLCAREIFQSVEESGCEITRFRLCHASRTRAGYETTTWPDIYEGKNVPTW